MKTIDDVEWNEKTKKVIAEQVKVFFNTQQFMYSQTDLIFLTFLEFLFPLFLSNFIINVTVVVFL